MTAAEVSLPGIVAFVVPESENRTRPEAMLYRVGRFLQLFGLLIVPSGIAGNLVDKERVSEGTMLTILCAGAAVFTLGWLLQRTRKA
jgi:hypothetical protein